MARHRDIALQMRYSPALLMSQIGSFHLNEGIDNICQFDTLRMLYLCLTVPHVVDNLSVGSTAKISSIPS